MENIYNYTKFTNVSRVKKAVYPLYFTGYIDVSSAAHRKPRKKYRPEYELQKKLWIKVLNISCDQKIWFKVEEQKV